MIIYQRLWSPSVAVSCVLKRDKLCNQNTLFLYLFTGLFHTLAAASPILWENPAQGTPTNQQAPAFSPPHNNNNNVPSRPGVYPAFCRGGRRAAQDCQRRRHLPACGDPLRDRQVRGKRKNKRDERANLEALCEFLPFALKPQQYLSLPRVSLSVSLICTANMASL